MPETLKAQVKQVRADGCFDNIIEVKQAILNQDNSTAFALLNKLKGQIELLDAYIEYLETVTELPKN